MLHPDDLATIEESLEKQQRFYLKMLNAVDENGNDSTKASETVARWREKMDAIEATLARVRALAVDAQDATPATERENHDGK